MSCLWVVCLALRAALDTKLLLEPLWPVALQEAKQAQRQLKAQRRAMRQQAQQAAAEAQTAQAAKAAATDSAAASGLATGKGPSRQNHPESQVRPEVSRTHVRTPSMFCLHATFSQQQHYRVGSTGLLGVTTGEQ